MKRPRYFQWLAGEAENSVTTLESITCFEGEYFYNFADGETCNERFVAKMTSSPANLKQKVIVEIQHPSDRWKIEEITKRVERDALTNEAVDVPTLHDITQATGQSCEIKESDLGTKRYIPPKYRGPYPDLPSIAEYPDKEDMIVPSELSRQTTSESDLQQNTKLSNNDESNESDSHKQPIQQDAEPLNKTRTTQKEQCIEYIDETDPVYILVKNCKKHNIEISLDVNLSLPSVDVYKLIVSEYEDGKAKFLRNILRSIDLGILAKAVSDGIVHAYEVETSESSDKENGKSISQTHMHTGFHEED